MSSPEPICKAPRAAAADGLSKLTAPEERPMVPVVVVAGDFLTCWGDDRGPLGEKAAWVTEKGVETGGVAVAPCCACEGVLPCDKGSFPGVGVDMAARYQYADG